jgi:hypothetical protein
MKFDFLNYTTLLPIDESGFEFFLKRLDENFLKSFKKPSRNLDRYTKSNPIHFVNETDYIPSDGTDALGAYTFVDPTWRRPVIKICPGKIFEYLINANELRINAKDFKSNFYLLIAAVTIHETAHFLMDLSDLESNYPRVPLEWAIGQKNESQPFAQICPERNAVYSESLNYELRWVEESLANAIMLKQKYKPEEINFLSNFVSKQSGGYLAALNWVGTLEQTVATATSFAKFKQMIRTRNDALENDPVINEARKILNNVVFNLGNNQKIIQQQFHSNKPFISGSLPSIS